MTICLALVCDRGEKIVMISDSMITSPSLSIEFEHKTPKLRRIAENCAIATAGDALVHTELFETAGESIDSLKNPSVGQVVECIKNAYAEHRRRKIMETILQPRGIKSFDDFFEKQRMLIPEIAMTIQRQIDNFDYGLEILVGGVDSRAHIHTVVDPGTSFPYDSIGYVAIGSGYPHATTTFISYDYHQDFPLNKALLVAYEAKKISEKSPGVGSNITSMCVIGKDVVTMLKDMHVKKVDEIYQQMVEQQVKLSANKDWANELNTIIDSIPEGGKA